MSRLSKRTLLIFVLTTLIGSCLHFVHALLPSPITALFSPVNESLWEHLKILFWPYLAASFFLLRKKDGAGVGARCLSLLIGCGLMLLAGWCYHVVLGGEALAFDVCLYVLLMALVFFLPAFLPTAVERWRSVLLLLVVALAVAILLFTVLPPVGILFTDLSSANTWSQIPC